MEAEILKCKYNAHAVTHIFGSTANWVIKIAIQLLLLPNIGDIPSNTNTLKISALLAVLAIFIGPNFGDVFMRRCLS